MSVELLQNLATAGYLIAALFLVVTIVLFFVLRIPAVMGDLSGRTARKAIENIRQSAEHGEAEKAHRKANEARGRLTDKISQSGRLLHVTGVIGGAGSTEKIATSILAEQAGGAAAETTVLDAGGGETTVLGTGGETTVLDAGGGETTVLGTGGETTVLGAGSGETSQLSAAAQQPMQPAAFQVDVEFGFSDSTETVD